MVTSSPRNAPTYNPFAPKSVNGVFNNGGNGYQWADPNAPRKVRPTNLFGNDTPGAASRNAAQNFLNQGQQGLQPTINPEPFAPQSIAPEVNLANLTPKFQDIWIDPIRQQAPVNTQQNAMQTLKTKCSNDVWSRTYSDTGVTFSIELKGLYSTKLPRGYHSLLSLVLSTGHMRQLISNYPTSRFFSKSMTPSQVNFLRILANELSTILSSAQKLPSPTAIR